MVVYCMQNQRESSVQLIMWQKCEGFSTATKEKSSDSCEHLISFTYLGGKRCHMLTDYVPIHRGFVRVGGCPSVVAQWHSTGSSSQRCPGFDSQWLPAFSISSILPSSHLNLFISSLRQDTLNNYVPSLIDIFADHKLNSKKGLGTAFSSNSIVICIVYLNLSTSWLCSNVEVYQLYHHIS